ncbi:hypothetical protein SAZ_42375 [Streptomyces noursei ZPM]|uniref:Uncharacterized protein n=1 Tax=Streptomyces noursei TaxID=1971 RepID=A0A401QRU4_STRNR|nr:hypothetical protein [Streptomyces noursei]AKA01197.1 hypothetical protein SAZ_00430 [Streptomyces noursei ZPM]AKA08216.1 hypothetical protein SAZ_42375 [Streptomyces noursei ZPM]UWS76876.1 hypothetical protein N1H47_39915 [Streptomyces noursei]GCB88126.1 hypothetical protein SALB_00795 [Streptomyces noursei]
MSLTSSLKDPSSAISRFLAEQLPFPNHVLSNYRKRLTRFPAPVEPRPEPGQRPEWRMLGHTIDHRLRVSLGAPTGQPIKDGVLRAELDDNGWPSIEVISTVQAAGAVMLEELRQYEGPNGQPLALSSETEGRLIRLCHIASSFEAIFRHVGWIRGNSLGFCEPGASLDDLVGAVPGYVVDDIRQQMELAASPGPFSSLRELPAHQRLCGPVFDGSRHVGGADADFVLDRKLIDCKATKRPERMGRAEIYQLAGYLLLDYSDTYDVQEVGLYLSRQGALIDWSNEDFLGLLGAQFTLPDLRAGCQYVLTDGAEGTPLPPVDQRRRFPRPRDAPAVQESLFDDLG